MAVSYYAIFIGMSVIHALLQVADVITTNRILAAGGSEANPIVRFLQKSLGKFWGVPKFAFAAVAPFLAITMLPISFAALAMAVCSGIMVYVVQHNVRILRAGSK